MDNKICCFFGHRQIKITEELKQTLKKTIEDLITKNNVLTFLFGSRSDFNYLCHLLVTQLKEKYPALKRIAYTAKSETCILENESDKWRKIYLPIAKQKRQLLGVEEEYLHKTKYTAGKADYIARNQAMINNSDYCIVYYDEDYKPPLKKGSKRNIGCYQPQSGTSIAYHYAQQKKKIIINIKHLLSN